MHIFRNKGFWVFFLFPLLFLIISLIIFINWPNHPQIWSPILKKNREILQASSAASKFQSPPPPSPSPPPYSVLLKKSSPVSILCYTKSILLFNSHFSCSLTPNLYIVVFFLCIALEPKKFCFLQLSLVAVFFAAHRDKNLLDRHFQEGSKTRIC